MTVDVAKLVRMAEQITANLAYTDDADLVSAKVADHLNRFWAPSMRQALAEYARGAPERLSAALSLAIPQLHGIGQEPAQR